MDRLVNSLGEMHLANRNILEPKFRTFMYSEDGPVKSDGCQIQTGPKPFISKVNLKIKLVIN